MYLYEAKKLFVHKKKQVNSKLINFNDRKDS